MVKTTDDVVTKYVYGIGLIGEETGSSFKTYHFDYRGSTAAITDINGNITDTFTYDTYGNLVSRTGTSEIIFLYNGQDGVVTDENGLIYMRARYYSPELRRFINADIIAGEISNAITLNRYAYANGNPVSNVDPFGLSVERGNLIAQDKYGDLIIKSLKKSQEALYSYYRNNTHFNEIKRDIDDAYSKIISGIKNDTSPEEFLNNVKIRIDINSNYNTSGDELIGEGIGFFPVLGEIFSIVDFASDKSKDIGKIWNTVVTAIAEKDVSKLTPLAKLLDNVGNIMDAIGFINAIETLVNWNSDSKIATEVAVYVKTKNISYMYLSVVDSNLMFKEMYSGYTGQVIKTVDPIYQINMK